MKVRIAQLASEGVTVGVGWEPVTSDQDCGLLRCTVHHRLGHACVLPTVAQLGVQDGQIPNRLLLHTGDRKRGGSEEAALASA